MIYQHLGNSIHLEELQTILVLIVTKQDRTDLCQGTDTLDHSEALYHRN